MWIFKSISSPDIPPVATVKPGQVSFLSLTAEIQLETLSDVQSAMRRLDSPIIFATIKDLTILGIRLDWWPNWQQWLCVFILCLLLNIITRWSFVKRSGSDDIKNMDLTKVHNLSGPIAVEGAEPGDCLVVDILDGAFNLCSCLEPSSQGPRLPVVPFEDMPWGFTVHLFSCHSPKIIVYAF